MQGMVMDRIERLQEEMAKTQQHLQSLDHERTHMLQLLLRQQGAVQALQELLAETGVEPLSNGTNAVPQVDPHDARELPEP